MSLRTSSVLTAGRMVIGPLAVADLYPDFLYGLECAGIGGPVRTAVEHKRG